jgi:hypothetical protein
MPAFFDASENKAVIFLIYFNSSEIDLSAIGYVAFDGRNRIGIVQRRHLSTEVLSVLAYLHDKFPPIGIDYPIST